MNRLNAKQKNKYIVIKEYASGKITRKQASIKLGCSPRWVTILKQKFDNEGIDAFVHKNTGNNNAVRTKNIMEDKIVNLYKERFDGFNFTHFYEIIVSTGELRKICGRSKVPAIRTVTRILNRNGIISPQANKPQKKVKLHPVRFRKPNFGDMVQLDGSIHDWFETGKKSTLHLAIDDATSKLVGAHFEENETTLGYFRLLLQILLKYGIPKMFYTDRRTSFEYKAGKVDEDRNIQFRRVCTELGIEIITTSSAQAKGRVERSFRTHQDRLISECKLYGINTIEEANKYLLEYVSRHNEKFAIRCIGDSFTKSPPKGVLDKIVVFKYPHKILNGHVVSHNNKQYAPLKDEYVRLNLPVDTPVDVLRTVDGEILIRHELKYYKTIKVADYKSTSHSPPMSHPWKAKSYQEMLIRKGRI